MARRRLAAPNDRHIADSASPVMEGPWIVLPEQFTDTVRLHRWRRRALGRQAPQTLMYPPRKKALLASFKSVLCSILKDLDLLERHEATADHAVEFREKCRDLLLRVDDLDDNRQVFGQILDLGRV